MEVDWYEIWISRHTYTCDTRFTSLKPIQFYVEIILRKWINSITFKCMTIPWVSRARQLYYEIMKNDTTLLFVTCCQPSLSELGTRDVFPSDPQEYLANVTMLVSRLCFHFHVVVCFHNNLCLLCIMLLGILYLVNVHAQCRVCIFFKVK